MVVDEDDGSDDDGDDEKQQPLLRIIIECGFADGMITKTAVRSLASQLARCDGSNARVERPALLAFAGIPSPMSEGGGGGGGGGEGEKSRENDDDVDSQRKRRREGEGGGGGVGGGGGEKTCNDDGDVDVGVGGSNNDNNNATASTSASASSYSETSKMIAERISKSVGCERWPVLWLPSLEELVAGKIKTTTSPKSPPPPPSATNNSNELATNVVGDVSPSMAAPASTVADTSIARRTALGEGALETTSRMTWRREVGVGASPANRSTSSISSGNLSSASSTAERASLVFEFALRAVDTAGARSTRRDVVKRVVRTELGVDVLFFLLLVVVVVSSRRQCSATSPFECSLYFIFIFLSFSTD